jgi:hypothetical protein
MNALLIFSPTFSVLKIASDSELFEFSGVQEKFGRLNLQAFAIYAHYCCLCSYCSLTFALPISWSVHCKIACSKLPKSPTSVVTFPLKKLQ